MRYVSAVFLACVAALSLSILVSASAAFDISVSPSESVRVYPGGDYTFGLDLGITVADEAGELLVLFVTQTNCPGSQCYEILAEENLEPGSYERHYETGHLVPCDQAAGELVWFLIQFSTGQQAWRPSSDPGWVVEALPKLSPNIAVSPRAPRANPPFTLSTVASLPIPIEGYQWSIDGEVVGTEKSYTGSLSEGAHEIELRVQDPCSGEWEKADLDLRVSSEFVPPDGRPIAPSRALAQTEMTFSAASVDDPDGGRIESYEWDFGDGTTADGMTVRHSYQTPGTYRVTLTACDDDEQCSDWELTVSIQKNPLATLPWDTFPEVLTWSTEYVPNFSLWEESTGKTSPQAAIDPRFADRGWRVSGLTAAAVGDQLAFEIRFASNDGPSADPLADYVIALGGGQRIQIRPGQGVVILYSQQGGQQIDQIWSPAEEYLEVSDNYIRIAMGPDQLEGFFPPLAELLPTTIDFHVAYRGSTTHGFAFYGGAGRLDAQASTAVVDLNGPSPLLSPNIIVLLSGDTDIVRTGSDSQAPLGSELATIDDFEPAEGGSEFGGVYEWDASDNDPQSGGSLRFGTDDNAGGYIALEYENHSWLKLQLTGFPAPINGTSFDGLVVTLWSESDVPPVAIEAEILTGRGFTSSLFLAESLPLTFYIPFAGFKEYGSNLAEGIPFEELEHIRAIGFFPQNETGTLYISELAFYSANQEE